MNTAIPSSKLTWQWKLTIVNRRYIFKRYHFSLLHEFTGGYQEVVAEVHQSLAGKPWYSRIVSFSIMGPSQVDIVDTCPLLIQNNVRKETVKRSTSSFFVFFGRFQTGKISLKRIMRGEGPVFVCFRSFKRFRRAKRIRKLNPSTALIIVCTFGVEHVVITLANV